jgi:hypothetical protein
VSLTADHSPSGLLLSRKAELHPARGPDGCNSSAATASVTVGGADAPRFGCRSAVVRAGQIVGHSRNPLAKRQRHQRRRSGYRRSSIPRASSGSNRACVSRELLAVTLRAPARVGLSFAWQSSRLRPSNSTARAIRPPAGVRCESCARIGHARGSERLSAATPSGQLGRSGAPPLESVRGASGGTQEGRRAGNRSIAEPAEPSVAPPGADPPAVSGRAVQVGASPPGRTRSCVAAHDRIPRTAPRVRNPRVRGSDPASGSECADRGFGVPDANSSRESDDPR